MLSDPSKVMLRKEAAERRAALKSMVAELSRRISDHFLQSVPVAPGAIVSGYCAIGDEADPAPAIAELRSAIRADASVGNASASSNEFVCNDCVPPSTAASAWIAVRTMLFSGCCAVKVEPAVCV